MPKHIFTIPSDAPFVDALAQGLWEQAEGDPLKLSSMLVLLPTRRSCRSLREAFIRVTGGKAALLPRMQPLGDVDETEMIFTADALMPDLPPAISPLRRQMVLTRLIIQKDSQLPLGQAIQLASALAALLDQVHTEGRSFSNLQNLVPNEYAEHWQVTLKFLEVITNVWPDVLAAEGCLDPADRRNRVLDAQADIWRKHPPAFSVIAAGSTGSIPAVAALMNVVAALPLGMVVLPGVDKVLAEDAWQEITESHPQFGLKQWLELADVDRDAVALWPATSLRSARVRLLNEAMRPAKVTEAWRDLTPDTIPETALHGLTSLELDHQQEEAETIALRMRSVLEEAGKTASLVTPDRALAERVSASLRRWGVEVNDSAGCGLAVQPVGSFLRDVLNAARPSAGAIEYLSLMKHPLAAGGVALTQCRHNARAIEMAVWRGIRLADGWHSAAEALRIDEATKPLAAWLEETGSWLESVTATWLTPLPLVDRIRAHMKLAEQWATTHETEGRARLWQGDAGEAAALWLDDWQQAAAHFPAVTGEDYVELFENLLRGVTVRPAYGTHPRLSILGALEARLLHADVMILGGLNEGTWPPEAPVDPWMSRPMKKAFGLPMPERRIGLSAHDFVQLASAPEIMITRAKRVDGTPTVPSRFLLQLETVLRALKYEIPMAPWADWARELDAPMGEDIKACDPPSPRPPISARPKSLSVTEIGTWRRNPYAIYARRILKLKKLDAIDEDITAADRGTVIHEALEKFIALNKDTWPVAPLDVLLDIGRTAFAPYANRPQVAAFWWPRFERIAAWFVEVEQERRANGIMPLATESDGKIVFAPYDFTLRGRADRIDKRADGSVEIIDYKTGTVPSNKTIDYGYDPQLALLAIIAEMGGFEPYGALTVGGLSYWKLKGDAEGGAQQDIKKDHDILKAAAWEGLENLLVEFAKPETPYEAIPKPEHRPRYDDYAHLARLAEWGREAGE